MKVTAIDPTTNNALGEARLKREVLPGLHRVAMYGTRLGRPVLRTADWDAQTTRDVLDQLVAFVDATGYILRVEATSREQQAIRIPKGRTSWHVGPTFYIRPLKEATR
jgi:hypothetical protein